MCPTWWRERQHVTWWVESTVHVTVKHQHHFLFSLHSEKCTTTAQMALQINLWILHCWKYQCKLKESPPLSLHFLVVVFFHLPTGFWSSRTSTNTKDPACGIGWCRGTRPTPEVWRATGKECAREGKAAACAEQGPRQEEIRTMSEVEESGSRVPVWVCDNSSLNILRLLRTVRDGGPSSWGFRWQRCQALATCPAAVPALAHYKETVMWYFSF